ncbi:hypothetical protein MIND_00780800 [Mycena indigotica]|uniref:Uncharacterized protein n=1 Tax=Mycena indigotica TaxID=2126181 RepID=A0A8H6SQK2_9AGAR|nr:uncharacterized protein MIND_00780800 [Mycena indigotica]KAF7302140.1 hypothetical protein MIND_00780800 [Mycena indigotica]
MSYASSRCREALLPHIFRAIRCAPAVHDFPSRKLWPYAQTFLLSGNKILDFTSTMYEDIAAQIREGLVGMKQLKTFIVESNVISGLWSELLDAFSVLSTPCHLCLRSHWDPPYADYASLMLEPRKAALPFNEFTFPFAFVSDKEGNVARRTPATWVPELNNVRTILVAAHTTLESVWIPGELFPAMQYTTWNALTELYLYGLWPVFGNNPPLLIPRTESKSRSTSPTSIPKHISADVSSATESLAEISTSVSVDASRLPLPTETDSIPSAKSRSASPTLVAERLTTDISSVAENDAASPSLPILDTNSARQPDEFVHLPPPPAGEVETESPTTLATATSIRSPVLVMLEAMPNLRILDMSMVHQADDPEPPGMVICSPDAPPSSPSTFLRHLNTAQLTSVSMQDRTVEFLPASLKSLSLTRTPYMLSPNAHRTPQTPSSLLAMLKKVDFPSLLSLKIWYAILSPDELAHEKALLEFLPTAFPLLEQLELCRRWDAMAISLEGRWDPVPIAKRLVSQFKNLRLFNFDPHPPERVGWPPALHPTSEFREFVGRLHAMAEEIVNAAPWIWEIGIFREYGLDPELYWEWWNVVPGPDGKVGLDRPPPPINDSIFYP